MDNVAINVIIHFSDESVIRLFTVHISGSQNKPTIEALMVKL